MEATVSNGIRKGGLFGGKTIFQLNVRVNFDPDEVQILKRIGFKDKAIFQVDMDDSPGKNDFQSYYFRDAFSGRGHTFEFFDVGIMHRYENELPGALENISQYIKRNGDGAGEERRLKF